MQSEITVIVGLIGIICLALGAFFAIRGVYKYKEYQAGEKDELWTFLSMILGCGSLVLSGLPLLTLAILWQEGESLIDTVAGMLFIGLLLGLGAIGLTTFYYYLKWQAAK